MRPATPDFNFAQPAGPVSPPTTPTSAPTFAFNENRRHGTPSGPHPSTENGAINSTGFGHQSSYTSSTRPEDLIPRSSSEESGSDSEASIGSPPHSLKLSPAAPVSRSVVRERTGIVVEGNFTLEEFTVSDYKEWGIDEEDVVRPNEYEGAESDRARSPPIKSDAGTQPGSETFSGFLELRRDDVEDNENNEDSGVPLSDNEREAWLEKQRAERRRRRRSSNSVEKRSLSFSIGSDTDDEDLQPFTFEGANEVGSSARRLKRKGGKRTSLIFDDPPVKFDHIDEED
ncbi:hypothetical protein BDZ45DRAFT_558571, partial [Acephala macrosclerotiorum]